MRYLEAGAGAGAGAGADKNTCMKTDFALSVVFGLRHVICGFLKKGEIISIAAQNKIDPASLAVTDQLICSQGKRRLTLDYLPFHDMTFQ